MDTEVRNLFENASKTPEVSEVFAKHTPRDISAQDIFAGDENLYQAIEDANRPAIVQQATQAGKTAAKAVTTMSVTHIILIVNVVIITAVLAFLLLRPNALVIQKLVQTQDADDTPGSTKPGETIMVSEATAKALDKAISWELAQKFYDAGDFGQAHYVFTKMAENLTTNLPADLFLKDFFKLRMALCLHKSGQDEQVSSLFTVALQSRSPVVRALANYNLMFIEMHNNRYLNARKHAYQTLGLLKAFEENFPQPLEADCYFTLAEAITRQILVLNNAPDTLPGQLWSDTLMIASVPQMTQAQLRSFLQTGTYKLGEAAVAPRVEKRPALVVGSQWSAISVNAPLAEVISRFASTSGMNVNWETTNEDMKYRSVTVYMPAASQQNLAEVTIGSTGLMARFDGKDNVFIHDPQVYANLDEYKTLLTKEAIATWHRFLQVYRGDHRTPNAHFSLGKLQEYADQIPTALSQYKYLASRFSHNPLAPYGLLNASKIKTNLHDYAGAKEDLNELIIHHSETKVVDQAHLYLAEATMMTKNYDSAIKMFRKVYNLDLNRKSQQIAAYGLGKCFYETQQYEDSSKWLAHAINLTDNPADVRLHNAYFMFGKCQMYLKDYEQASTVLRKALGGPISQQEYVSIILELVKAHVSQEKYLVALNILENVPLKQLTQEDTCRVLIARADMMRQMNLHDAASALLRRKMQFIADSEIRAKLSLELAKCYIEMGDLTIASKRLTDAIYDLPPGELTQQANLLLVDVSIKMGNYRQAKDICLKLLGYIEKGEMRDQAGNMLGKIYTHLGQYDKAALAYAGVYDTKGANP